MTDAAGAGAGVELIGLDEAMRDIARWADQLGPTLDRDARSFAADVESKTASRVPVLTGALASSVQLVDLPGDEFGAAVSIGDGLDYAPWIEFGGSRGRPYISEGRYLYPTALAAEGEWLRRAEDTAEQTARSYPWST